MCSVTKQSTHKHASRLDKKYSTIKTSSDERCLSNIGILVRVVSVLEVLRDLNYLANDQTFQSDDKT